MNREVLILPKTIFNTTEKSNFILNMKDESVDRLSFIVLAGICILITISQIPAEFGYGMTDMPFLALGICGVFAVVTGIILFLRQRASENQIPVFCIAGFLFIWSLISYYDSYNLHTALWGQDGRYDGLMTMLIYIFIFLTSAMLADKKIEKLFDLIICVGVFQCLWSFYQILPFGTSYYKNLEVIAVKDVNLTSGLAASPFFFAMLMNIMLAIALYGSVFSENKKRRILYTIAIVPFTYAILQTHTLSGIIGIILASLINIIVAVKCRKIKKFTLIICIAMWIFVFISLIQKYKFYDGGIVWQDSFYRLGVTGYFSFNAADFDVNNLKELYSYLWNEAISAIKQFPLTGTGVDCFAYTQYKTTSILQYELNSIDRPYNDYLFLTATRGIPYLIGYVALIIYAVVNGIKNARQNNEWYFKAIPAIVIMFAVMSIFNNSAISYMPFMWIILGLSFQNVKKS